ncbi:hypothetical protein NPIL_495121, partial [Nephila pilipes]
VERNPSQLPDVHSIIYFVQDFTSDSKEPKNKNKKIKGKKHTQDLPSKNKLHTNPKRKEELPLSQQDRNPADRCMQAAVMEKEKYTRVCKSVVKEGEIKGKEL